MYSIFTQADRGGYHLASLAWRWRHEIVQRAHGAYRAHRCRRSVFADWADPDTVGRSFCNYAGIQPGGEMVRESATDVPENVFFCSARLSDRQYGWHLCFIKRVFKLEHLGRTDLPHRRKGGTNRSLHLLACHRQSLAPERGWAV